MSSDGGCGGRAAQSRVGEIFVAGKHAISKAIVKSEHLVVSEARIERDLGDEIGRRVEGESGGGVVTVAGPRLTEEVVVGVAVGGDGPLGVLDGNGERYLIVALGETKSPL